MSEAVDPSIPFPKALGDRAWALMQQWQDFVHARPDDECALALFMLMADMLLSNLAYTHQWTLEETLLYWYRTGVPLIASKVEDMWKKAEEDDKLR